MRISSYQQQTTQIPQKYKGKPQTMNMTDNHEELQKAYPTYVKRRAKEGIELLKAKVSPACQEFLDGQRNDPTKQNLKRLVSLISLVNQFV